MSTKEQSADLTDLASKVETKASNLIDTGAKEFMVGGELTLLKFTAAARFRLFLNIEPTQVQEYVSSEAFKLRAVGLLLAGKKAMEVTVEGLLDIFDSMNLSDDECHAIYEWVLQRTINFMVKEAEAQSKAMTESLPQVELLSNSLTGLKR